MKLVVAPNVPANVPPVGSATLTARLASFDLAPAATADPVAVRIDLGADFGTNPRAWRRRGTKLVHP